MDTFNDMIESVEGEDATLANVEEKHGQFNLANFSTVPDFGVEDISMPILRLAQGLTSEVQNGEAKPGQWLLTGFSPSDTLNIIPLAYSRRRTLRAEEGGAVMCAAHDGTTGSGTPGGDCTKCSKNVWSEDEKGNRHPPECVFSYLYTVYVVEHNTIAMIDFRRTSIQAGKTLNLMTLQRGFGKFAAILSSQKQTGKRGSFYQIVIAAAKNVPADVLELASHALGG